MFPNYPDLGFNLDSGIIKEIEKKGKHLKVRENDVLVEPNEYIKIIPLVIFGLVKVMRINEFGREIFLYYIKPGESCAVSLSTTITGQLGHIRAVAEEDSELITIPASLTLDWFDKNPSWRQFVVQTLHKRFENLLSSVDSLAFLSTDERLIIYLKEKSRARKSNLLQITHQEIAQELSTTREMISRLLKKLEKKDILKLSRNKIELIQSLY